MTKKILPAVIVFAGILASCSSIRHTSDTANVQTTVATFAVADLQVAPQKVSKTTSWSYNPFKRVSVGLLKENTEAALVNENNADILIEPQYIVEKRGFLRGGSVTVTGFPAKFENFHKMTPQEAEILRSVPAPEKKAKKRFFIF